MHKVIIADDRPKWMVREDNMMICFTRCSLFKKCSSRHGMDCKRLGGAEIPILRGGKHGKQSIAKKKAEKGNTEAATAD